MVHPCIDEVLAIMGDRASARTIEGWIEKVQKQGFKDGELISKVQEYGEEALRKAYLKKRNTALLLQKQASVVDFIKTNFPNDPVKGWQAFLGGIQSDKMGMRDSVYNAQEALERRYINDILTDLQRSDVLDDFRTGEMDVDVAKELGDLTAQKPTGAATKNEKAKKIAAVLRKHMDYARQRANDAGADIGTLSGYITTQTHDMFKIRRADLDAWIDDVMKDIDLKKTFGDADPADYRKILKEAYDEFSSGMHDVADLADPILAPIKRSMNVGSSLSKHRAMHFKDAEAFMRYNKKYGKGNLRETIFNQMVGIANKTALMERMGPNPREVMNRSIKQLMGEIEDSKARNALADNRRRIEKLMDTVDGAANIPGNPTAAKYGQIVRAIQSMAKLGGAVVSAIVDIPISASELRYQGHGALSAYNNAILGSFNRVPRKHRKELGMMLGVYFDGMNASMTHRMSGREDFSGASSRALGTFFKWSGLTPWTDRMRLNSGLAMSARLGAVKDVPWAKLDDDLKRVLGLHNITEQDWPLLQKAVEKVDETGDYLMTPSSVRDLSDDDIIRAYGADSAKAVAKARDALEDKFRGYFVDRIDHAVINPDARTMAFLKQGTRPGTVEGEFFRLLMQFKAFPTAVVQKMVGREIYGRGAGGWKTGSGMLGIAHTVAATTAFGYLAMSAKDILKGREPRDPEAPETWAAAMLQGGALGLYGDFLLGNANRYGKGLLESMAGPTLGSIAEANEILTAIRSGDDPSAKAFKFALANTPFANLFYARIALDYLIIYRIQEMLAPGYLHRMERTIEQDQNQEFIVHPSSVIPYGG